MLKKYLYKFFKNKNLSISFYKNGTTKHAVNSCCTLKLNSSTEKIKEQIDKEVKSIVKQNINSPENLIKYIQAQGIKVYKVRNAEKVLAQIGEEEGFLTPLKGIKAIFLNIITGLLYESKFQIQLNTNAMMIFDTKSSEIYTIARALYKYYGFKNNLPGYDYKSQEIFKKVYNQRNKMSSPLRKFAIKDMYACKEAISRDLESINFTVQISKEYENAGKTFNKIKNTNSASI